jgi:purine nucleoside phosphorylase
MHTFRFTVAILFLAMTTSLTGTPADKPTQPETFIAVVGGTSFGTPLEFADGLAEKVGTFQFETKAGISPVIYEMRYKGVPFYYIPIYGFMDRLPGEDDGIYHVRTWAALYELGVTHAIGGATSGAIDPLLDFDDIVLIDDFMEWRSERPNNVLEASGHSRPGVFPNFEIPLSPSLRALLIDEAKKRKEATDYSGKIRETGTFYQFAPGRFESPAEIRAMGQLGAHLTSMNQSTCIVYARQFGIRYGSICSISNPAVGVRPFTFEEMQASVQKIAAFTVPVVLETIARIPEEAMDPEPSSTGDTFEGNYLDPDGETTNG